MKNETSPYLLQHANNPVDWYPWGKEAFARAKAEDKPVFLSIGYSTCHWCHVMAHESFEDDEIAALLNQHFISIKVDKEERPDIDSIYMSVCQAFTGSGGWPASIFLTPEQKPFFAGTYFPKQSRGRSIGLMEVLKAVCAGWENNRPALLRRADSLISSLRQSDADSPLAKDPVQAAIITHKRIYDRENGGFGRAPKFPMPHTLLFLMACYESRADEECLLMAEHTLRQMYRGGLFDHIGYGFCRYSTDERYLAPHFEKMLYDNALLTLAYCKAYILTQKPLYLEVAQKTAAYILREMTSPEGAFYSAQDADSDGEEGKYYLLTPNEILRLLGRAQGDAFCRHFDITPDGNFEGKSIPNLLGSDPADSRFDQHMECIRQYRKERCRLHLDDKILTAWNGLMIAAMCSLYRLTGNPVYLNAATRADRFIREKLGDGDVLYVSYRANQHGAKGFLDDYASFLFAQLALYGATLQEEYLCYAERLCQKVMQNFRDEASGGYFLYSAAHEQLILRPKETYDGAIPSGNSLMAWNLVQLSQLVQKDSYRHLAKDQLAFLAREAGEHTAGHTMFLLALEREECPPPKIIVVATPETDVSRLPLLLPPDAVVKLMKEPTKEYPLKDGKTTFYVCRNNTCQPPTNELPMHHHP